MKLENVYMLLPERKVGYGDILVENGRIAELSLRDRPAAGARRVVLPGLVNCHGHTAMTLVRGLGGGLPLQRWLDEAIFPVEAKMKPEDVRAGAVWGVMEMLAGGTTAVADMYDFPGEMGVALLESGMKGRICRVGLSFIPGRLEDCVTSTREWNGWISREIRRDVLDDISIHSEYLNDEKF